MRYRSSVQTSLLILAVLAKNKEYAQYNMPKAIGKDYRTVLRHLKLLEAHGLIHLDRTEPARKGGKDRKIYKITLLGLIEILKIPDVFNNIDIIAQNFPDSLPLIFGKSEFFKTHGFKNLVVERLRKTLRQEISVLSMPIGKNKERLEVLSLVFGNWTWKTKDTVDIIPDPVKAAEQVTRMKKAHEMIVTGRERLAKERITRKVLLSFSSMEVKNDTNFLLILKKDNELAAFIESELENLEKEYKSYLENIRSWKEILCGSSSIP